MWRVVHDDGERRAHGLDGTSRVRAVRCTDLLVRDVLWCETEICREHAQARAAAAQLGERVDRLTRQAAEVRGVRGNLELEDASHVSVEQRCASAEPPGVAAARHANAEHHVRTAARGGEELGNQFRWIRAGRQRDHVIAKRDIEPRENGLFFSKPARQSQQANIRPRVEHAPNARGVERGRPIVHEDDLVVAMVMCEQTARVSRNDSRNGPGL